MRFIRYMLVVAALLTSAATRGQINPANPAEPTAPETPAPPAETYALRLETTPAGGGTYNIDASTRYAEGTTVGLRAYPAASFTFVAWEQDGEVLSTSAAYTYTMPARDVVLTARYRFTPGSPTEPSAPAVPDPPVEPDYGTLFLAVLPQGGGSINVGSGNRYEAGSKVSLKATASAGFTFSHWTAADTVLARTASLTYTVPAGESRLAAHFTYTPASPGEPPAPPTPPTPAQYRTLCLVSDPQGGGYFNPQSGGTYEVGSTVKVQAYANQWYTFAGWTSADTVVSASANYSFVMPDDDVTLTAHYTYHYNPSSPGEPSAPAAGQASLYGMTENGLRGQTIVYPVYLENSQPVSGILVDLQFPQGFEVQADRVVLSGRASAHTMDVRQQDDGTYRFFLIGDEPFAGDNGKLFEVPVTIPDTAQTEHNYPVRIARGMNHAADGTLTPISVRSGFIYVGRVSEDGLYARFSYDKLNARVQFTNLSSAVARSFTWDLGDGTTSTDRDPLHVYAEPGTYTVSLTAHGQTGDDVAEMQVLINAPTTWRVDGLFHLGGEGSGVRRFASADELFAFLGNATVTGSLTVGIAAGERHVLALTEEHLAVLRAMQETLAGRDLTLAFVSEGEGPTPILDFGAEGTTADEAVLALFSALGGSLVADGVELRLCGVAFNPDLAVRSVAADRTTVAPGDSLTVTWEVANVGEYATGGGWTEQVTLVSADGADTRLLGTSYHEAPLAAGSVVRRRLAVALPALPGVEGDARIEVRAVGDATTGEAASSLANNTALSEALLQVEKVLRLEVQPSAVDEASAGRVALRLMRSGSWSHAGTFTLTSTADSRVQVPSTLTIAEGQSATVHYLTVVDNHALDSIEAIDLVAEGEGYAAAKARLTIVDDELPTLTLTTSRPIIAEGDTLTLQVTAERSVREALTVTLTCDVRRRFTYASQVVIPAGGRTATVVVTAVNDDVPGLDETCTFTASAPRYIAGKDMVLVEDDDMPALELTLTPATVQEGAGPVSVAGTLRRTAAGGGLPRLTVRLSDDADGGLHFASRTLQLARGEAETHFTFGPVDNALVDGDRTYTVTAAVWLSSCGCSASGETAGAVQAQLHVLDDDGPALGVASSLSTVKEGGKTTLTVSRNTTANSAPLTVTISSDYDEGLTYSRAVTIPAGQQTATVEVSTAANSVQGDSHAVVFIVQADGYASAVCYVMVTDQTLPDMAVKSIVVGPEEIAAGDAYTVDVTLMNVGVAAVPPRSVFSVQAADETIAMTIADSIQPMEEKTVTMNFVAPKIPGRYSIGVVCNKNRSFGELQTINNSLSVPFAVRSAYTFSVGTDHTNYQSGETVKISGQVEALRGQASGVAIEPYVICYGSRQALQAVTDADGHFEADYILPAGVGGDFSVGVCTPGENSTDASTVIHVYGMACTAASYIKSYLTTGIPKTVRVPIKNLSSLPLHNIRATVRDNGGHYDVTASSISLLDGGLEEAIEVVLQSDKASQDNHWERVALQLDSDEGATLSLTLYCYANIPDARLVSDSSRITTNITSGRPTIIPITLSNTGLGQTGRVMVVVPDGQQFFTLSTPSEIPSLGTGDSTVVGLCFNPEGLDVNVVQRGSISIGCENAKDYLVIPYSLKVVGEDEGALRVSVEDETTIYGTPSGEHPYLEGASVTLKDCTTGAPLFAGVTTAEGSILFEHVPEGYYTLFVSAPKHTSYVQNVLVSPGQTTDHLATVSYEAISVSSFVEEIAIEDRYKITSEVTYETQVPVPAVELIAPDTLNLYDVEQGGQLLYYVTVVNRGLITANNVCVELPVNDGFLFTPLAAYSGFDLAPGQSRSIPVLVTLDGSSEKPVRKQALAKAPRKGKCHSETWAGWEWVCKSERTEWIGKIGRLMMRSCDPDDPTEPQYVTPKNQEPIPPEPTEIDVEDLELRYPSHPVSQVDLNAIYDIVSTLSCAMSCAFPAKWSEWKEPDRSSISLCVLDELMHHGRRNVRSRGQGKHSAASLRASYLDRLQLLLALDSITYVYYEELTDAPQLAEDVETFNLLMPCIDGILEYTSQLHDEGILYSTAADTICQDVLHLMPQQNADWYDFSLSSFIQRLVNTFRLYDDLRPQDSNHCDVDILNQCIEGMKQYSQEIEKLGYVDRQDMINSMNEDAVAINGEMSNVCSTVRVQLSQEMVLTRQAFRGTIVIENNTDDDLTEITALISVADEVGHVTTAHEMQISLESTEGLTESSDGTYTLAGGQTGKFIYLFIPTKYAAPEYDVVYNFSGQLQFNDGDGVKSRSLYPASLLVKPSPELDLTYFMQRDVYGDDPLTEAVEPMHPAEFALVINNKGYGAARNVQMATQQPQIVENEKGLLVDFEIISSMVNGAEANLALGQTIVNDLGTIEAHSQSYVQWWLQSTLLGHFIDYDVEYTHVTSRDNPDLSLFDEVTIHELVHGFTPQEAGGARRRGFLVNDIADSGDLPDQVYFSDATQAEVTVMEQISPIRRSDTEYVLPIVTGSQGWVYGSLPDPTGGRRPLVGVSRLSDGEALPLDNVWQTDRTLRDGKDWLYEDRLHYVAHVTGGDGSLVLTFGSRPDVELAVERIDGVPDEGTLLTEPLTSLTVRFNKPIKESTFTTDDLTLHCQGVRQDASRIVISRADASTYRLDLTQATEADGFYMLAVQTAGIDDAEGYAGSKGWQVSWVQYADGDPYEGLIELTDDALEVHLAPLPVRDWLTVTGNFSEVVRLDIYDMGGVRRASASHLRPGDSVYAGQLAAGFYAVTIVTDRGVCRTRVLKR